MYLFIYFLLTAQTCVQTLIKMGDGAKIDHYWLVDSRESSGGYGTNQVITQSNSLWLKIDENIMQEVTIELKDRYFVSFSSAHFAHQFIQASNTLRIFHPDLQSTNGKYMLMGDVLTTYRPHDLQGGTPKAKITYVANLNGDFTSCDFDFEEDAQKQVNYKQRMENFVMDLSEL